MATAKKPAPKTKQRDYKAERERTRRNKENQEQPAGEELVRPTELKGTLPTQDIPLVKIVSDPDQPRKFFDISALMELSKSILQHGVVEPILLRPYGKGYMIVFGERRFRACMLAAEVNSNITTIPAMVKEMTAEEAFELQIAENLHRKDPHPLEEAYSYKKLLERNNSVEDIAIMICKSAKFVSMRLILNDLIQEWQDVFFANKIKIGDAVKLAKLAPESQLEIFTEEAIRWQDEDFELSDIDYMIGQNENNLDSAAFDPNDATLYPEAGPCSGCKFNSLSNLVLFASDKTTKGICSNSPCYWIKRSRSYKNAIESVMMNPEIVFITGSSYLSDTDKPKVAEVKKMGATVLNTGFTKITPEQLIAPSFNDFMAANPIELTDENQEEYEARIREEFEEEAAAIAETVKQYEEAFDEGRVKKAFIVCGHNEGKFTNILLHKEQQTTMNMPDGSPISSDVQQQIKAIEGRLARAGELDSEKIWIESRKLISDDEFSRYTHSTDNRGINSVENHGLTVAMFETLGGITQSEFVEEVLQAEDEGVNVYSLLENMTTAQRTILFRLFLKQHLFPGVGSPDKSLANFTGFQIIKSVASDDVAAIEQEHKEKAEKRARNAKAKIEALMNPKQGNEGKGIAEETETEE